MSEQAQAQPQPPTEGRDAKGRFTVGNPGGPGNPFAREVAKLRLAMIKSISEQDVVEISDALKRRAKEGVVSAARLLLSYSFGKPTPGVDPDRLDLDEWEIFKDSTRMLNHLDEMMEVPESAVPVRIIRAMRVASSARMQNQLLTGIEEMNERDRIEAEKKDARRAKREAKKAAAQNTGKTPVAPSTNGDVSGMSLSDLFAQWKSESPENGDWSDDENAPNRS